MSFSWDSVLCSSSRCDGEDNCGDNSDESQEAGCFVCDNKKAIRWDFRCTFKALVINSFACNSKYTGATDTSVAVMGQMRGTVPAVLGSTVITTTAYGVLRSKVYQ